MPLINGIADGLAHGTFGQMIFLEPVEFRSEFFEEFFVVSPSIVDDGFWWVVAFCDPLLVVVFVMIELRNVVEDDGGVFSVRCCVFELAPCVDPATSEGDVLLFFGPCLIGAVAITLDVAFENLIFFDEDVV